MASVSVRKNIVNIEITLSKIEAEKLAELLEQQQDLDDDLNQLMIDLKNGLYS